jgi:hypothetical protein
MGYLIAIFGAVMLALVLLLTHPWTWITIAVIGLLVVLILGGLLIEGNPR